MKALIGALLSVFLLASCSPLAVAPAPATDAATPLATPGTAAGIQGQVLLGPTCPVVPKNDPNCADRPYQATLSVLSADRQKVTQFTTDSDGKFQVNLAPGDYILHPESPNGAAMPFGREQPFSVVAGQYTQLTVHYDSGMR